MDERKAEVPPIDLRRALGALRALFANPDDTAQVFTIIESLTGRSRLHMGRRFAADPSGARLLRERPDLVALLSDRAALRRLPDGSLGRAYLDFVESEGISADGLVAASEGGEAGRLPADLQFVHERMRDTHDLWHAVTGYKGDTLGEAALLAFSLPQTRNPGVALIVLAALLHPRAGGLRALVFGGWRRGLRAAWLPPIDWAPLLAQPLAEVRARLRVTAAPAYTPVRTTELRAMGVLA